MKTFIRTLLNKSIQNTEVKIIIVLNCDAWQKVSRDQCCDAFTCNIYCRFSNVQKEFNREKKIRLKVKNDSCIVEYDIVTWNVSLKDTSRWLCHWTLEHSVDIAKIYERKIKDNKAEKNNCLHDELVCCMLFLLRNSLILLFKTSISQLFWRCQIKTQVTQWDLNCHLRLTMFKVC